MDSWVIHIALYSLGSCVFGIAIGWIIHVAFSKRRSGKLTSEVRADLEAQVNLEHVTGQRDKLANAYSKSSSMIKRLQAANARRSSELESLLEKSKLLAKNVLTLRTERESTKIKVSTIQNALDSLRQQSTALQSEFDKTREFYKRELLKSLEKRKLLEKEVKEARFEQEAFAKSVESSVLEHGSAENMIAAAQLRLGQLDVLERNVNKLEAENAQLRQDGIRTKQESESRERELAELEELKLHNKQLVRCVEALEGSRQEHETDAEKYRQQADQSEKLSETLRLKLDDLQKNFADIEKEQDKALEDARNASVVPMLRKQR